MKYVKEMVIIFGITLAGEVLNQLIPLPVPAGVYGLFLLLGLLCSGIVLLPDVEHVGGLLLDLMPLMFIPGCGFSKCLFCTGKAVSVVFLFFVKLFYNSPICNQQ